jgi:hypothetical protein
VDSGPRSGDSGFHPDDPGFVGPVLYIPAALFIVGAHFFPLAALFRIKIYYLAGVLLCALVIVTLLAAPQRLKLDGLQIAAWQAVLGLTAAIVLWASGLIQFFTVDP